MNEPKTSDSAIWPVVESFLDRFRRGERPALSELIGQHPEIAEQLLEIIPAVVEMEQFGDATGSYSGGQTAGSSTNHPESLGDYKILRRIGEGGMGVVYEAEHGSLKSRVALKVIHPRFRAEENYLRRFRVEARSAAGLHHTNIVSVFDYGEQDGVFYYAMQYIQGQPLDAVLDDLRRLRAEERPSDLAEPPGSGPPAKIQARRSVAEGLLTGRFGPDAPTGIFVEGDAPSTLAETVSIVRDSAESDGKVRPKPLSHSGSFGSTSLIGPAEERFYREVARVGSQVADALDHAHRAGVLHRDIKPSNLLLDEAGNVWITDFGLAKLEEGEDASKSQDLVGTLRYMAPERVRGVSCRAGDLYALGATIYELATLRAAFEDSDQVRLIDRIAHEPPRPPRSIDRLVPRDLETIILKAMAKEPEGRFASAQEMAEELRKFVGGHPIRSRRITSAERLYRWCRRNPWLATANISAAALLITLAVGSTIAARSYRDDQARIAKVNEDLKKAEIKQRERFFDSLASEARARLYSRRVGQRFESLDAIREAVQIGRSLKLPAEEFDRLRDEAIAALMLPDIERVGPSFQLNPDVVDFRTDNQLTRYAQLSRDGSIRVRRFSDNGLITQIPGEGEAYTSLRFSPSGRFLVARLSQLYRIWDLDTGGPAHVLSFPGDRGFFALSPNDRRIAVCLPGGNLEVRDLATGQVAFRSGGLGNLKDPVYRPDGTEIAVISQGNSPTCRIVDAETGRPLRSFPISGNPRLPRWSADGSTLAIHTGDNRSGSIDLHRAENGSRLDSIALPLESQVLDLKMHPAVPLLFTSGWDGILRLWDWSLCRERLRFLESNIEFDCLGENEKFVVRNLQNSKEVSVWRVDPALELVSMSSTWNGPLNQNRISIHPGGRLLSVGTETGVLLRDLARRSELAFLPIKNAQHTAFDPNGDLLTNGDAGFLRWPVRIDPTTGALKVGPPRVISPQGTHFGIDTDRTGQIFGYSRQSTIHLNLGDRTLDIPTGGDS